MCNNLKILTRNDFFHVIHPFNMIVKTIYHNLNGGQRDMAEHDFIVTTQWSGGRDETGTVKGDVLNESISIPSSLGGVGEGTNPDEMLIAATSSCYIISLAAILE